MEYTCSVTIVGVNGLTREGIATVSPHKKTITVNFRPSHMGSAEYVHMEFFVEEHQGAQYVFLNGLAFPDFTWRLHPDSIGKIMKIKDPPSSLADDSDVCWYCSKSFEHPPPAGCVRHSREIHWQKHLEWVKDVAHDAMYEERRRFDAMHRRAQKGESRAHKLRKSLDRAIVRALVVKMATDALNQTVRPLSGPRPWYRRFFLKDIPTSVYANTAGVVVVMVHNLIESFGGGHRQEKLKAKALEDWNELKNLMN